MGFGEVIVIVNVVVFFAILAGLLFHKFLGSYIEGAISGLHLLLIIAVYGSLLIAVITLKPIAILLLLIFAGVLVYPLISSRRMERSLDEEKIEGYRTAIEFDPRNLAARSKLARALHRRGSLDEAIAELHELLEISPREREEAHFLEKLLAEKQGPGLTCPVCRADNPPNRSHCHRCERFLEPGSDFKLWLLQSDTKQIALAFTTFAVAISIILFGLTMVSLTVRLGMSAVMLLGFIVVLAFLKSRSA